MRITMAVERLKYHDFRQPEALEAPPSTVIPRDSRQRAGTWDSNLTRARMFLAINDRDTQP